jgi:4-amino-4-deoxy-L-arabinose transferase-like glycosyltransferase
LTAGRRRWHWLALALILGTTGLRVWYLASACTLDLAPDEAHYWDWSRHLDWSYYSKGPAVAFLIHAAELLAHSWRALGAANPMLVVRLPAVACGALLLLSLYLLTLQVYGDPRLGAAVIGLAILMPIVSAGALIMTIDAPYCCCWGWALVFGYQAVFRGSTWSWAAVGLTIGLGILAKQTMILFIPGLMLFLLQSPEHRVQLRRPGLWLMIALAGCCSLPIVVWNAQHDWVTFRHVGGQAGVTGAGGIHWLGPLVFLGTQFAMLLGYWFLAWGLAMYRQRPWRDDHAPTRYLWWTSATAFGVFLLFSFKTDEQPNWPVTAYISGLVLGTASLSRRWQTLTPSGRRISTAGFAIACVCTLLLTLVMLHTEWMRQVDPTCRLRGWQTLAAEVDRLREDLQRTEPQPILIAGSAWPLPGELAFYCSGHPTVYSLGLGMADRHSQYDYWRPNPVLDEREFAGRTMIVIGPPTPSLFEAFDTVDTLPDVVYEVDGRPMASWNVSICRGYRGFSATCGHLETGY